MISRLAAIGLLLIAASASAAEDLHPIMNSDWWVMAGSFRAERDFEATAGINLRAGERAIDFERSAGLESDSTLFMSELGWQFGNDWGIALQHFRSSRGASRALADSFEWQGATYAAGAQIEARTAAEITRVFFSRRFRDQGAHSLRLGAGLHWLDLSAVVAGQASLDGQSSEFIRSAATASLPVPNIGAWYRYSPGRRWMLSARVDWLSASIDEFSGGIWNVSAGGAYAFNDNLGIGANYQYFELNGDVTEPNWYGKIKSTFSGPYLYLSGYW